MKTIGVIGLGSIGARHSKNLRELGYYVLGYDPAVTGMLGSSSLEHVISDSDAIVIASPTSEHYQQLLLVADYDKPIFVEKPVSDTEVRIPDFGQLITMVGYNLRFHSCVKKAKEWIDNGHIGRPLWAQFTLGQYNEKAPYLRDGVILNWSHELDLALYLLGPAKLTASSTRITRWIPDPITKIAHENDDMSDILLTHENGCRSTIHLDYVTNPEIRRFTIAGDKESISVNLCDPRFAKITTGKEIHYGLDSWNDNYIEEMQAFLDRCDGKETLGCTGAEGLEVLKICLEVRKQAGLE